MSPRLSERFRSWARLLVVLLATAVCCDSRADAGVPLQLQAQLVARLGTFDRNFAARAGQLARVLVVHRGGDVESTAEAAGLAKALVERGEIGGVPSRIEEVEFSGGPDLAKRCRDQGIALVYFTVGLESEMPQAASALTGVDVLTVGTTARHAENGAVVGFGLEEARTRIVLNLRQARAQNVNFKAELLKLARIVE